MKKNLFKTALLLFSTSVLISCSSDNKDDEDINYKLESIVWKIDETNKDETFEKNYPEKIFKNPGNTTITVSIETYKDIKETSTFQTDDKDKLNKWRKMKDTLVCVPTYLDDLSLDYRRLVTYQMAPLRIDSEIELDPIGTFIYDLNIAPGTQVRYKPTIVFKNISAIYKSRFVSEDRESSFELSGIWKGTVIVQPNVVIIYEDIPK